MQRSLKTVKGLLVLVVLTVFLFSSFASVALAADTFGLNNARFEGIDSDMTLPLVIARVVQVIFGFLGIIAVLLVVYGGFLWMTSAGDPAKVEKAKKVLLNAIIGLIIILLAFVIVSFVIRSIQGVTGGNGNNNHRPPGGDDDLGRWGVGRGPIESTYPENAQRDVPIDTYIAVTFKEAISPSTICNASGGSDIAKCDGDTISNVEICLLDVNNICVAAGQPFDIATFSDAKVNQTADGRTFVFSPNAGEYLGAEDGQNRKFQVTLKSGIRSIAEPDESVFKMLINEQYAWYFTTNGKLDLDPPEIVAITGVYPYPDNLTDNYLTNNSAQTGESTLTISNIPTVEIAPKINGVSYRGERIEADVTQTTGGSVVDVKAVSTNGFVISGLTAGTTGAINFTISDNGETASVTGAVTLSNAPIVNNIINLTNGIYVQAVSGDFPRGSAWQFSVTAPRDGKEITISTGGTDYCYLMVEASETRNTIIKGEQACRTVKAGSKSDIATNFVQRVNDNLGGVIVASDISDVTTIKVLLKARTAGVNDIVLSSNAGNLVFDEGDLSGSDVVIGREQGGLQFDAYRNSIIQINFNEAINPIAINNIIVRYDSDDIDNESEVDITGYQVDISNQYRTIELRGPDICGKNSCGDDIYCWPIRPGSGEINGHSTNYQVLVKSAKLIGSTDTRCSQWGGSDDTHGRCSQTIDNKTVFYPKARDITAGIVDMSANSFNGSLNIYTDASGKTLGISEGQSESSPNNNGGSGRPAYYLNDHLTFQSDVPVHSVSGQGDDFYWQFWMSNEIDDQAPLISSINPIGDAEITDDKLPIELNFDRLMRSSTLRPGWNYGSTDKDKSQRYLVLETLTGLNPIGYWVEKNDFDGDNDGWADYTAAYIKHNDFSEYIRYSPLAGSGVQSITQNCFLPGGGPEGAGSGQCAYSTGDATSGCVRDEDLGSSQVKLPNPASYGVLNCNEVDGASVCSDTNYCLVSYFDSGDAQTYLAGSWVISKDYGTVTVPASGATGCCFGSCKSTVSTCADIPGNATLCSNSSDCRVTSGVSGSGIRLVASDNDASQTCCFGTCVTP